MQDQNDEPQNSANAERDAESNAKPELSVTNPIQAASEIFYKPKGVFDALAVKDNWSWIPFILLSIVVFFPAFLYFGVVDFEWWREMTINAVMPDGSPAEKKNMLAFYQPGSTQWSTAIMFVVIPIVFNLIFAFYYTLVTRNDSKSIQGFTDWYGAMWWMSMPFLINALVSLMIITMQNKGVELSQAVLVPLSVAYIMGIEMTSSWFNFLNGVRLDYFWSIYLTTVCLRSWTDFSTTKSVIVAIIPTAVIWSISAIFAAS